jgi:serine/threonine protein kinase
MSTPTAAATTGNTKLKRLQEGAIVAAELTVQIASIAGDLLTDIPFVSAICSAVTSIASLVNTVHGNKEQCARLALRVEVVFSALAPMVSQGSGKSAAQFSGVFVRALEQLTATLEACQALIAEFADKKAWKRWLTASRTDEQFKALAEQLGVDQAALQLGLDVDAFQHRDQDRAAAQRDVGQLEALIKDLAQQSSEQVRHVGDRITTQVDAVRSDVLNVERAIQATITAQNEEIRLLIARLASGINNNSGSTAAPAALTSSKSTTVAPEAVPFLISPLEVDIAAVTSDATGVVFAGQWLDQPVSIKRLLPPVNARLSAAEQERFRRELQITGSLRHPRLLGVFGGHVDENGAMLVTEPIERGSLEALAYGGQLAASLTQQAQLGADIAAALEYAHRSRVWHRGVRAAACVVTWDWRGKLTEFARAKSHASNVQTAVAVDSDWRFMAPEAMLSGKAAQSAESDMFSFGMLLYELCFGRAPLANCVGDDDESKKRASQALAAISDTRAPLAVPDDVPPAHAVHDLMRRCWQRSARLRPTARVAGAALRELIDAHAQVLQLLGDAKARVAAKDAPAAEALLQRAAQLGSATAHAKLGDLYAGALLREHTTRDGARALASYAAAAALNDARAAFNAGCLLVTGELVAKNESKAIEFFEQSKKLGNKLAEAELNKLEKKP